MYLYFLASGDHRLFLDITLSSNSIPEDALNGTKVGTFSVINPKPGQTYTLALVQAEAVPFKIVGRDLILITGVPLDYETTNSTAIGVLISDSNGTTFQRMFEIRITSKILLHGLIVTWLHGLIQSYTISVVTHFPLNSLSVVQNFTTARNSGKIVKKMLPLFRAVV